MFHNLSFRKILDPDHKTSGQLMLKFNADDPDDTATLKDFIHEQMAEDISLPLSRVIHHFSKSPYNWQEWHIVTVMARLVADRSSVEDMRRGP